MRKKLFLITALILCLILSFTLVACNNGDDSQTQNGDTNTNPSEKPEIVAPIFQGIEFVDPTITKKSLNAANDYSQLEEFIESDIDDTPEDSNNFIKGIDYFSTKGTKAYIVVKLLNPSKVEILSLVMNGEKYQSYQFNEESDSENIKINVDIQDESGVQQFKVEQIKYVDGTEIKECIMDGKDTINVGVTYEKAPSLICNVDLAPTVLNFNINLIDSENILNTTKGHAKFYLFEGTKFISSTNLKKGPNDIIINKLTKNTKYHYYVVCSYYKLEDNKKTILTLEHSQVSTLDYIKILSQEVGNNYINLELDESNKNLTLESVQLFKDNNILKTVNSYNLRFENLLSNTKYVIKINYSHNNLDYSLEKEFTTLQNLLPSYDLTIVKHSQSFDYKFIVKDPDNTIKSYEANLLLDGNVINTFDNNIGTFDTLLNDRVYVLKTIIKYDLNDGNGIKEITKSNDIKLDALQIPEISLNTTATGNKIDYQVVLVDSDNTITALSCSLFLNGKKQSTLTAKTGSFENLLFNNVYVVKVDAQYNLNNGNGVNTLETTKTINTVALITPTINVSANIKNGKLIGNVNVQDLDKVATIENIELYKKDTNELISACQNSTNFIFDNVLSNTRYLLKVNYSYDLKDGKGKQTGFIEKEYLITKSIPTMSTTVTPSDTSVYFDVAIVDINSVGHLASIELFKDEAFIQKISLTENNISNLESNSNYTLATTYSYDLNDGKGAQEIKNIVKFSTLKKTPVLSANVSEVTYNSIKVIANIEDIDNAASTLTYTLLKDDQVIENNQNGLFLNVYSGTEYVVKVVNKYDIGQGEKELIKEIRVKTPNKEVPEVIASIKPSKFSADYEIRYNVKELNILDIELIYNGVTITSTKNLTGTFNNLYSNSNYQIKVTFDYDINQGGARKQVNKVFDFVTQKVIAPTMKHDFTNITNNKIVGKFYTLNTEVPVKYLNIQLYKGSALVKEIKNNSVFDFDVESNTLYTIRLVYNYDLHDGQTAVEKEHEINVESIKNVPIIKVDVLDIKHDCITYDYSTLDKDNTNLIVDSAAIKHDMDVYGLVVGNHKVSNLKSFTAYNIEVKYHYELNDGLGLQNRVYTKEFTTRKVTPTINLNANNLTYNSFKVVSNINDANNAITADISYELYLNNQLVTKNSTGIFENLMSESTYVVKVITSYDILDGPVDFERTIEVTTLEKAVPKINVIVTPSYGNVEYSISSEDLDVKIKNVAIIKDAVKVGEKTLSSGTIDNLLSNNQYILQIIYDYDINRNGERREKVVEKAFNTLEILPPVIETKIELLDTNNIKGHFINSLNDVVINPVEISLFKGNLLVKTIAETLNFEFALDANVAYKLVFKYNYDLNDGKGIIEKTFEHPFNSLKYLPIANIDILEITDTTINYKFKFTDLSNAGSVTSIKLYKGEQEVRVLDEINNTINNLVSYTTYKFVVLYQYDLNDGAGATEKSYELSFTTLKETPTYDFTLSTKDNTITINHNIVDKDSAFDSVSVKLYLVSSDQLVEEKTTLDDVLFTSLLNNNEYRVDVTFNYLLNCENGNRSISRSHTITTRPLVTPTLNYAKFIPTKNTIKPNFAVNDPDNIIDLTKCETYKDDALFSTTEYVENVIVDSLSSGTLYNIKTYYNYDLNDGKGVHTEFIEQTYTTKANITLNNYKVLTDRGQAFTNSTTDILITLNNLDNAFIKNLTFNGCKFDGFGNYANEFNLKVTNGSEAHSYSYEITNIEYSMNGFNISDDLSEKISISLNVVKGYPITLVLNGVGITKIQNYAYEEFPVTINYEEQGYNNLGWFSDDKYSQSITRVETPENNKVYGKFELADDNFTFELMPDNKSYKWSKYAKSGMNLMGKIVVPNYYKGLPVDTIAGQIFTGFTIIQDLILPEHLKKIDGTMFELIVQNGINVPSTVTYICPGSLNGPIYMPQNITSYDCAFRSGGYFEAWQRALVFTRLKPGQFELVNAGPNNIVLNIDNMGKTHNGLNWYKCYDSDVINLMSNGDYWDIEQPGDKYGFDEMRYIKLPESVNGIRDYRISIDEKIERIVVPKGVNINLSESALGKNTFILFEGTQEECTISGYKKMAYYSETKRIEQDIWMPTYKPASWYWHYNLDGQPLYWYQNNMLSFSYTEIPKIDLDKVPNQRFKLPKYSKPGEIFKGWAVKDGGKIIFENEALFTIDVERGLNLYPIVEYINYNIKYNLGGINATNDNLASYTIKSDPVLKAPICNGYRFLGWYDNAELQGEPITQLDMTNPRDIELYAKWEQMVDMKVTYVDSQAAENLNKTILTESELPYTLQDLSKPGYIFGGWYLDDKFVTKVTQLTDFLDTTLYAKWSVEIKYEYDVTPDVAANIQNPNSTVIAENQVSYSLSNATLTGYTFQGWYSDPERTIRINSISEFKATTVYGKFVLA